jgi:signal transduction histidine kinase
LPDLDRLFSLPVQTIIYRIVQEALTNIGKHANPEHVTVTAAQEGPLVRFVIQDDGKGFDLAEVLDSTKGLGLASMEERLNMVGGSFEIKTAKNKGTRLSFSIPVRLEDNLS